MDETYMYLPLFENTTPRVSRCKRFQNVIITKFSEKNLSSRSMFSFVSVSEAEAAVWVELKMVKKDVEVDITSKETEIIDAHVSALNPYHSSAEWKGTMNIAINSTRKNNLL